MLNFSWVAWSSPFWIFKQKNSSCHLLVTYFLAIKSSFDRPSLILNFSEPQFTTKPEVCCMYDSLDTFQLTVYTLRCVSEQWRQQKKKKKGSKTGERKALDYQFVNIKVVTYQLHFSDCHFFGLSHGLNVMVVVQVNVKCFCDILSTKLLIFFNWIVAYLLYSIEYSMYPPSIWLLHPGLNI